MTERTRDGREARRGNLLVFNLAADRDDPLLAFALGWLERLAACYDRVDVITMRAGRLDGLPPNVYVWSVGKEHGASEFWRAITFYRLLAARLRERRYAAAFAHMMPLFALMGAPLLAVAGVPLTLWYTHRQQTRVLAWATQFSRRVVSAVPDSFPIATPKLRALGHGIDTDFFAPHPAQPHPPTPSPRRFANREGEQNAFADRSLPLWGRVGEGEHLTPIVQVARLMPIKRQDVLIRALAVLRSRALRDDLPGARVAFVGDVPPGTQAESYAAGLHSLAAELGVVDRVTFAGSLPAAGVAAAYAGSAVAVNLSPPGLFDKAALEAMACGVPTVVSNPAFLSLLGDDAPLLLLDHPAEPTQLAERLRGLLLLSDDERRAMGERLRAGVVWQHSLDALIPKLVSVLETGEVGRV